MMNEEIYDLAGRVDYQDAQRYILARGWVKSPYSSEASGSFHFKEHDVRLPMDRAFLDYTSAMVRFATLVARAEGRKFEHVLLDLSAKDVDRLRLTKMGAKDGNLESTVRFLSGVQQALFAVACHAPGSPDEAQRFVRAARVLNSEADSFEVVIDTPLEVEHASESFGRKASITLMQSVAHIARSLQQRAPERIVAPSSAAPRVSTALCEALLEMAPRSEAFALRFAISWSPSRESPEDVAQQVVIDPWMYEPLQLVLEQLKKNQI